MVHGDTTRESNLPSLSSFLFQGKEELIRLGEAILVGGRMGAVEQPIYKWKEYTASENHTYYWNRYNAIETVTYKWNKYNCSTTYTWNKYTFVAQVGSPYFTYSSTFALNYDPSSAASYHCKASGSTFNVNSWLKGIWNNRAMFWYSAAKYSIARNQSAGAALDVVGFQNDAQAGSGTWWSSAAHIVTALAVSWADLWAGNPETIYRWTVRTTGYWSLYTTCAKSSSNLLGQVTSSSASAYPNGGKHTDNYWYDDRVTNYIKGSFVEEVTAVNNPNAYPKGGASGSFWYDSAGSDSVWSCGTQDYPAVSSSNPSAYPYGYHNNDGYWYEFDHMDTDYSIGDYVGDRLSTDRDRWPDNGYREGFWYVFDGEA